MNQIKIGTFLKELRKEKNLTQEQLAELLGISNRSISRWENGRNMPDISLLVELAELYKVDINEIIDGERKQTTMEKELKDNLLKVAEYEDKRKNDLLKSLQALNLIGIVGILIFLILNIIGIKSDHEFVRFISGVSVGIGLSALIAQFLYMNGQLENWQKRLTKRKGVVKNEK